MKKGWQTKTLGDVAKVGAGNSAPQDEALFKDGTIPFFRTADAGRVRFGDICEAADYLNDKGAIGLRHFAPGTILFPKSGASTFLNHRVMLGVGGCVSSHLATIVADENQAHPRFLLYYLSTVAAEDLVQDHAYPSLNLPTIAEIEVHLPALAEQQRIVGILDEAFEGLITAKANAEKNLQNARALFGSVFGGLASQSEQERWPRTTVTEIAASKKGAMRTGPFGSQLLHSEFVDDGIAVLGIDNAVANEFQWGRSRFITKEKYQQLERYRVYPGDVLITIMGTCGRCAIVPDDIPIAINTKHLCCITLDQSKCVPGYLHAYFLYHPLAREFLAKHAKGAIMAGLNMGLIQELPVLLPSVRKQKELVEAFDSLKEETQRLARLYERKLAALEALKKSLLHEAFTGQLTATT